MRVQASIGASHYPNYGANQRALLRAADGATYQVTQGGKNAVAFAIAPDSGI